MNAVSSLTATELAQLAASIAERKTHLLEEIGRVLARSGNERYAKLVGEAGDAGDASVAALLRDVAEAEVRRDVLEVRDIVAAEGRIASGRYGVCVDCGATIGYARLAAYPTAKRCLACQQAREKGGRYGPQPSL
jgi:RNA polymerase-binding transcription factor DksA